MKASKIILLCALMFMSYSISAQYKTLSRKLPNIVIRQTYSTVNLNIKPTDKNKLVKALHEEDTIIFKDNCYWLKSRASSWAKVGTFKLVKKDTVLIRVDSFMILDVSLPYLLFGTRKTSNYDSLIELDEVKSVNGISLSKYRYNEDVGNLIYFLPVSYNVEIVSFDSSKRFNCKTLILPKETKSYLKERIKIGDTIILSKILINFSDFCYIMLPEMRLKVVKTKDGRTYGG